MARRQRERVQAGVAKHRSGALDAAEAIYRQVLSANPVQPDALHFLGMLLSQRGRRDEGIALIERATQVAPDYVDAFNNLGNVLRVAGRIEQAERAYRHALALDPRAANVHANLGAILSTRGDLDAAEAACRKALEFDPRHVHAYTTLGVVLKSQGRMKESIAAHLAAVAYDPDHPEAYKLLGLALCADGRADEAREMYRRWSERDPDNAVARHLLAACAGAAMPDRASDDYVRDVFDGMADGFDAHLEHLDYRAPGLVAQSVRHQAGEPRAALSILDAGCGTGLCAAFLRPYAATLAGVDLSPAMLRHAEKLRLYDRLFEAELTGHMQAYPGAYDLIVCADTFCYFGDLHPAMRAARAALTASGRIVFTVEHGSAIAADPGYALAPHGRYAHARSHVLGALAAADLTCVTLEPCHLRKEGGVPVDGLLVCAQQRGDTAVGVWGS